MDENMGVVTYATLARRQLPIKGGMPFVQAHLTIVDVKARYNLSRVHLSGTVRL
jgi:hypothetical protein